MLGEEEFQKRLAHVRERIVQVLSYHPRGITVSVIADEVTRLYKIGRLGFSQEVDSCLRDLWREGRVDPVPVTKQDNFWYGEKSSLWLFQVWRLTKEERARFAIAAERSVTV